MSQAEVGWNAFKNWLPSSCNSLTELEVLDFLISLKRKVSPATVLAYRNLLKLPLSKDFGIDFLDKDFSFRARA